MYSLKNLVRQTPAALTALIMAGLHVLLQMDVISMTADAVGAVDLFLFLTFGAFYAAAQQAASSERAETATLRGIAYGKEETLKDIRELAPVDPVVPS